MVRHAMPLQVVEHRDERGENPPTYRLEWRAPNGEQLLLAQLQRKPEHESMVDTIRELLAVP